MSEVKYQNVKMVKIESIKLSPYNPRKHLSKDDAEYRDLKESIERFGLAQNLVINKRTGLLVGGEQRLSVLKELGAKEVPVMEVDLSEDEEKELNIALNEIKGRYDTDKLHDLLDEIRQKKGKLPVGFDKSKYDSIMESFRKRHTGDFLNDIIEENAEAAEKQVEATMNEIREQTDYDLEDEYVVVPFKLTPEERDEVVSSLKIVCERYDYKHQVEALVKICEMYLDRG